MSLSVLCRPSILALIRPLRSSTTKFAVVLPKRMSSHRTLEIKPSDFMWKKTKDLWHFYACICLIFYGGIAVISNIFIGPATLAEIPEGYRPKHWEYYPHPISRFLQRYCYTDPQQEYEKFLNFLYDEYVYRCLNELDDKVKDMIKQRKDYQAYYMRPVPADYVIYANEQTEVTRRYQGDIDDNV